jgi:thiamine-monophosphate kinase
VSENEFARTVPTLGQIGEFGLIEQVARPARQGPAVLLGPGDDAAVVAAPDRRVVASMDLLVEGRHFRRDWSTGYQVGRKAAAQNLADIAAMGARPTALLVGLSAPGELEVAWAVELAAGLAEESALVGASVAGGDTTRGEQLVIAVTALGDLGGQAPVRRSGAHPGDLVAVAGELGWSAAGYELLIRGAAGSGPDPDPDHLAPWRAKALARHRSPEPPYSAGPAAAAAGATAMLDVSDGLLADLGHIARESRVAIDLDPALFPIPGELHALAKDRGLDPVAWFLTGGEDHALAGCFPADGALPPGWRPIGRIGSARDKVGTVTVAGAPWPGAQGWDHFRN